MVPKATPTGAISAASHASLHYFIRRGTMKVTAAEIARNAGLPERNFYRYFTTNEESIGPVL